MKAIVAVDLNWGIGCGESLLEFIPEDMKFFKNMTTNNTVVMGRATFDTLPGKKPLKDRLNVILTRNRKFKQKKSKVCYSVKEVFEEIPNMEGEIYIIGGEEIYTQFLPYCEEIYVTKIQESYEADKFFPNLNELSGWELVFEGEMREHKDVNFQFTTYKNKNTKKIR